MSLLPGELYAQKYPAKAALYLELLNRGANLLDDPARREALIEGLTKGLKDQKRCIRCGRPLKDEKQPGYEMSVGPDCLSKAEVS